MSAAGIPIFKYLSLSPGGTGTISFGQEVSKVYVRGIGDTVYMAEGNVAPTPSPGDGRVGIVEYRPVTMNGVSLSALSFAAAVGESAEIEAIGTPVLGG
jgi:hypothetical protein